MSQISNADKVGSSSAFSVDKIVGIYRGSYTSGTDTTTIGGYIYQYAIPHTFTRPVFCELLWSTDGITYVDGGASGGIAYSDSSNIYVSTLNATGTIYYKVIASWIDNYDNTNPLITPVLNTTTKAYFDSRQNYQKTRFADVITVNPPPISEDIVTGISHNFGYTPNAKIFFESITGQVWPQIYGGTNNAWLYDFTNQSECYAIITTTQLKIDVLIPTTGHITRLWYRVYLDQ